MKCTEDLSETAPRFKKCGGGLNLSKYSILNYIFVNRLFASIPKVGNMLLTYVLK